MVTVVISTNKSSVTASSQDTCEAIESHNQTFTVHKDYICLASPFFAAAFNGKFMEGESQSMRLDDVDPAVFGLLVHWIYFQKFDLPMVKGNEEEPTADYEKLAELWILGQRTIMPALQNYVVDVVLDSFSQQELWDGSNFGLFMELAAENDLQSPLSRLAINSLVHDCTRFFDAQISSAPPSLCMPIMKRLKLNHRERKSWDRGMGEKSDYHF